MPGWAIGAGNNWHFVVRIGLTRGHKGAENEVVCQQRWRVGASRGCRVGARFFSFVAPCLGESPLFSFPPGRGCRWAPEGGGSAEDSGGHQGGGAAAISGGHQRQRVGASSVGFVAPCLGESPLFSFPPGRGCRWAPEGGGSAEDSGGHQRGVARPCFRVGTSRGWPGRVFYSGAEYFSCIFPIIC